MKGVVCVAMFVALISVGCVKERTVETENKTATESSTDQWVVGGVYSIDSGEGDFGIAKILALDDEAVHVRVYKNRYPTRPGSLDPKSLSLGSIKDPDGFGLGHLPLSREGFAAWNPAFVIKADVDKDELEGYEMWKEAGGEVWP